MKGKVWKRLTAAATAALSALSLALGSGLNLTAHAEVAEEHYTKKYWDTAVIDNETVMSSRGKNEKLSSCSSTKCRLTFSSNNCKTNGQLQAKNRNFVISAGGKFTVRVSSEYSIRAIEFGDDISGSCSCAKDDNDNVVYKKVTGNSDYYLFENYDAPRSSLTFTADSDDGFSFEDIIVYAVTNSYSREEGISAYVNTPKEIIPKHLYTRLSVDNSQIVSALYQNGKLTITPIKVGETDVYLEIDADNTYAKGVLHYHIKVKPAKYTRYLVKDGQQTEYVSYLSNASDEIEDFPPIDGYYRYPGWYFQRDKNARLTTLAQEKVIEGCLLYAHYYPIQHFETKPSTCTEDGIKKYWYADAMSDINLITRSFYCFEDEACTKPITQWEWENYTGVIPATGHKLTKTNNLEPTCTTNGHEAYWYCENCKKYFSDEACADSDIITDLDAWKSQYPATGHTLTKTNKLEPTCTTDGHEEYWYCETCEKYFSDEACQNVIENIETWMSENLISATGHSYKDGICENCGAFEDGIGAKLAGYSLSLDGSIGVNFYMELSEDVIADDNAYLLVTYPNGTDDKMLVHNLEPVTMNGKSYYVFQCKVAATEMADTITAQMMTSSGDGTKYSYSVKEYADYLLAHTEDNAEYAEAEELVRSMLNYGAYAQTFKGHNTDTLPCELADLENYEINEHGYSASAGNTVEFAGANLSMLSNTTLRLFFKADDITDVTFTNGAEELEIGENNGLYFVEIANISPDKLSNDFTVSISDGGLVTYSPMTYCYQVSKNSDDAAFVNLVKAIAKYNDAAKAYFKEAM